MTTLAEKVDDRPTALTLLKIAEFWRAASCLRRPQARSSARSARSRFPFMRSGSGACHSALPSSAVRPIAETNSDLPDTADAPNSRREIST